MGRGGPCGLAFLAVLVLAGSGGAGDSSARASGVVAVDARISVRIYKLVAGAETAFQSHGYCADDSWIVQLTGSFLGQLNKEGSLHATFDGNKEQTRFASKTVRADLYAGGRTRRPR